MSARERIAALEAKCALLSASLKKADADRDEAIALLREVHGHGENTSLHARIGEFLERAGAIFAVDRSHPKSPR